MKSRKVRDHYPDATEYAALDGRPCWLREQLTALLGEPEEGDDA